MQTSLTSETFLKQKLILKLTHAFKQRQLKEEEKPDASRRSNWRDPKVRECSAKTTQVTADIHVACKSLGARVQAQTVLQTLLCSTSSKLKFKGVDWIKAMTIDCTSFTQVCLLQTTPSNREREGEREREKERERERGRTERETHTSFP